MSTSRTAALFVGAGIALGGCGSAAHGTAAPAEVASVATPADGAPDVVTLAAAAARRLGIATAPVTAAPGRTSVPYGALVYEADGSSWVFVETAPLSYQRAPVHVAGISGDRVLLTSGPRLGTEVVIVGAAELVGVETGIDGEE